jgi:hypothetical protein
MALTASVGLGHAVHSRTSADVLRECRHNSIDYKEFPAAGQCGAATASEWVADQRHNDPADLQVIAKNFSSDFHLDPSEYDAFAAQARDGMAYKNGDIIVDGKKVLTGGWSIGRDSKPYGHRFTIPGDNTSYWASNSTDVFMSNAIPVMVYFDNSGEVQFIVMKPCGNIMGGTKVHNSVTCQALNATQPDKSGKPNTWNFTTNAAVSGNAVISRVVYTFSDDNSVVTKNSLTDAVEHTFKQDGKVTVTVYAGVPGGHEIQAQAVVNCQKEIKFAPPFFECSALVATAIDQQKRTFRFTVKANMDANTKLKDVDFTLDNTNTTTGVTTMDDKDNIYKEYTFAQDGKTHTVVAKVNFTTATGVGSKNCQAQVTSGTTPPQECKPGIPVGDQRCNECKPGVPFGSPQCNEQPPLVNTGISAGSTISLFGATVVLGFFGHKLFMSRRARRMLSEV